LPRRLVYARALELAKVNQAGESEPGSDPGA
jgi:hypothetical protein